MRTLGIDVETYSEVDLPKCGLYKYTEHPSFEIIILAYKVDDCDVQVVDLAQGEQVPVEIMDMLLDPLVLKTAFNALFEMESIQHHYNLELDPSQWDCTMIRGTMLGLPFSLDRMGNVLRVEKLKHAEGKQLIKYFSIPCEPTKTNGMRTRNLPHHDPERWDRYKRYCMGDVWTEQLIREKVTFLQIPEYERSIWYLDLKVNRLGVSLDQQLIRNAITMNTTYTDKLMVEAKQLTNLENPNSVAQLKKWVEGMTGLEVDGLAKAKVGKLLIELGQREKERERTWAEEDEYDTLDEDIYDVVASLRDQKVIRMLKIRLELSKTSTKKYNTMEHSICSDGRLRGLVQYYGANRTGRWAGRLVQVHNLPRNYLKDLEFARELVLDNDLEGLELFFGNVPNVMSQLIRTAFVPRPGYKFVVSDFSAIEARVTAWYANEEWRLEVFRTHGKIYEASAAMMFKIPIEEVTDGSAYRDRGKVAELALGYQGGVNALKNMDTGKKIPEDQYQGIVDDWRKASPRIVQLWWDLNNAAVRCVGKRERVKVGVLEFYMEKGIMFIKLPSGRSLAYFRAQLRRNRFDQWAVTYEGLDQKTGQWVRMDTYGGKLLENIVQATARDLLADAMLRIDEAGLDIVLHVHDEDVMEVPINNAKALDRVNKLMGAEVSWAPGLPQKGKSFETPFYKKE